MNGFILLVVFTANILGSFSDPFEFDGDYGTTMNPIREEVFELLIPYETQMGFLLDLEDQQSREWAIQRDQARGPTLGELVTEELFRELKEIQQEIPEFKLSDLEGIQAFVSKYQKQKLFRFLHNTPKGFLSLDKSLPDQASQEGEVFSLPLLSSMAPLKGQKPEELKKHLLRDLFKSKHFTQVKEPKQSGAAHQNFT